MAAHPIEFSHVVWRSQSRPGFASNPIIVRIMAWPVPRLTSLRRGQVDGAGGIAVGTGGDMTESFSNRHGAATLE